MIEGMIGIAISIISVVIPIVWPAIPTWVGVLGLILGVFLIGIAVGLFFNKRKPNLALRAELTFHFYGDTRNPKLLSSENLWRWYLLRNCFVTVDNQGITHKITISNLYITFDTPVKIGTVEVNSPDSKLPAYEVKEYNNRFVIIVFQDELTSGTLNITVK
ncbi:hypothetical protein SDB56_10060 [Legionella pneumophila serogroup 1]